jgi:hypothetical protein
MAATDAHTTTKELLEAVFSVLSLSRCYKQNNSTVYLVMRQSPATNGVNTETDEATALEAVTRRQSVTIQQTEKT